MFRRILVRDARDLPDRRGSHRDQMMCRFINAGHFGTISQRSSPIHHKTIYASFHLKDHIYLHENARRFIHLRVDRILQGRCSPWLSSLLNVRYFDRFAFGIQTSCCLSRILPWFITRCQETMTILCVKAANTLPNPIIPIFRMKIT